jgi:hypothetical protein
MDASLLPDLTLPFVTSMHPQAHRVQELTEAWCWQFGLLRSSGAAAKFRALGYGRVMATLCTEVSLDHLALIVDWNSFFFIADDQQNNANTTHRTEHYEALVASMRTTIAGSPDHTEHDDHPLLVALRNLLQRTLTGRPDYWLTRFRGNLELWLDGHVSENVYRVSGTVPSVVDYVTVRRHASTVFPTLDLVEMAEGAVVSDALYRTAEYQTLILGIADIMCWVNDIHSLHMEEGDPINFVTVLKHHEQAGVREAIDAVTQRIATRVNDYLTAARGLPARMDGLGLDANAQRKVMQCVKDQQSWAAGMERWDRTDTIRFAPAEMPAHGGTASYVEDLLG